MAFLFFAALAPALAEEKERFEAQYLQKDFPGMEKTLAEWTRSDPSDIELWVAFGNFYDQKAAFHSDPNLRAQAETCWKRAQELDPWRLDVDFALAQHYQESGEFEKQYGLLARTLQSTDKGWRNLRWVNGQKLPKRSSRIIPEYLQNYISYYFGQDTDEGNEKAHRLIRLSVTYYPSHPRFNEALLTYYTRTKDWPHALKYLLVANQKDPRDSLVLIAIAETLANMGKKKEADIYYQRVLTLDNNGRSVEWARRRLGLKQDL